MSKATLLEVASRIQIQVPEVPTWYREGYIKAQSIDETNLSDHQKEMVDYDVSISWTTYHTNRVALSLIEAADAYEEAHALNNKSA